MVDKKTAAISILVITTILVLVLVAGGFGLIEMNIARNFAIGVGVVLLLVMLEGFRRLIMGARAWQNYWRLR